MCVSLYACCTIRLLEKRRHYSKEKAFSVMSRVQESVVSAEDHKCSVPAENSIVRLLASPDTSPRDLAGGTNSVITFWSSLSQP